MSDQIEADATIASVLSKLKNPERYVCGVLKNLYSCRKAHGNTAVRIGVMGKGMMPYYRVIFDAEPGKPDTDDRIFAALRQPHAARMDDHRSEQQVLEHQLYDLRGGPGVAVKGAA